MIHRQRRRSKAGELQHGASLGVQLSFSERLGIVGVGLLFSFLTGMNYGSAQINTSLRIQNPDVDNVPVIVCPNQ